MAEMTQKNWRLTKDCDLTDQLLERRNETSPDWLDLKSMKNIPVFVYGTEMLGNRHHGIMKAEESIYLGEAMTSTGTYELHKTENDYPVAFGVSGANLGAWPLYGEVWLVSPKTLLSLDQFEANQELTEREMRFVWLLEQVIKPRVKLKPSLKSWIYLGRPEYWEDQRTFKMHTREVNTRRCYMWTSSFTEDDIPDFLKNKTEKLLTNG